MYLHPSANTKWKFLKIAKKSISVIWIIIKVLYTEKICLCQAEIGMNGSFLKKAEYLNLNDYLTHS